MSGSQPPLGRRYSASHLFLYLYDEQNESTTKTTFSINNKPILSLFAKNYSFNPKINLKPFFKKPTPPNHFIKSITI